MTVDSRDAASPVPELSQLLADAKFSAPQPRPGTVSRASLIQTARSGGCRLVAVTAPAGYGKSTFLVEWAAKEDRPVAWVSLDRFDDDPVVLLASLASAYCRAGLAGPDLVLDMRGQGVSVLGRAAPRLAAEFRASTVPFVLMLDDLHEVQSPACHDVLGLLIWSIPPRSQLAAASRTEQPYLPRLRVSGEALEFGAADLALDAAGAQQIFSAAQVSLAPKLAAAVTERTEGWPAGLYLAALITKESRGQTPAVTGEDRYVADYLYRETLTQLPEDLQIFLRRSAVLDQLYGPLCDAVLESSGAAGQLRRLEAAGLFVIPLDRQQHWYRYHDLFQEFLLGELRRTEPGIIVTLHQRAADWYESSGSPERAVEHLLQTTDRDRAVRLVTKLASTAFAAGRLSTLQHWYRAIGDERIERYPPLAVYKCWEAVVTGDTTGAARWAAVVDAASFNQAPGDGWASFDSSRANLRAIMCAAGPEQMMADASFSVAQEPPRSLNRDATMWALAEAHLLAGHLDEARVAFAEASDAGSAVGRPEVIVSSEGELAWLAMDRGEWQQAATWLKRALVMIEENRLHDYVTVAPAFAGAARLSVHRGDPNEAGRQLAQAMRVRPLATYLLPYLAVRLRLQLAKVYLAIANPDTARQLLREIGDILVHRPALGTLIGEVDELRRALKSSAASGRAETQPLTAAELRLLPYLQTHLTVDKIAERLHVSPNTIKSAMKSIYRKLSVSSRNDAVQQATAIGLLGG